jgi:hypothetical protein
VERIIFNIPHPLQISGGCWLREQFLWMAVINKAYCWHHYTTQTEDHLWNVNAPNNMYTLIINN